MSSSNLELFPDDFFARKGTATPAGEELKEAQDQTVVSLEDSAAARQASQEDVGATSKEPSKSRRRRGKGKGRKAAGGAAESEPAASVLKFRLLDEASEDLDEILRCAEGRAAVEPEPAEPEIEPAPVPEAETEGRIPTPVAPPRRSAARANLVATVVILAIIAAGLYAGWYFAELNGDPELPAETGGETEQSSAAGNALTRGRDAATDDPADSPGDPGPQNALKAHERPSSEPGGTDSPSSPEIKPTVDVVRIEDDGSTLIAGAAGPDQELIVLHNGQPIGVVRADSLGQWVLLPEQPLGSGPHEFGLVIKDVEGAVSLPAPDPADAAKEAGPDSATPDSEAPKGGDASGGEAGATPAPGARESRLPAPEAETDQARKGTEILTAEGYPLPLKKPAPASSAVISDQNGSVQAPYIVQFASTPTAQGAAREWERLQKSFPEFLEAQEPAIQEAELSGVGTVFRLRAGAFHKLSEARGFCAAFRERRQDCLVVKLPDSEATGVPRLAKTE